MQLYVPPDLEVLINFKAKNGCVDLLTNRKHARIFVLIVVSVCSVLVAGCAKSKGELDEMFVMKLKGTAPEQREAFVALNKGKTITLTGFAKLVLSGGFGGDPFFYLETPDASFMEQGGLDIAVTPDTRPFAGFTWEGGDDAKIIYRHWYGTVSYTHLRAHETVLDL